MEKTEGTSRQDNRNHLIKTIDNNRLQIYTKNLRDLQDYNKRSNIFVIGVPESKGKEHGGIEKIFKEMMAKNFPNFSNDIGNKQMSKSEVETQSKII